MSEPGGQEVEQSPQVPKFELPPSGTNVRVERGSGEVEFGWKLVGENPLNKRIIVTREVSTQAEVPGGEKQTLRKDLTREEFISQNPVPGIDDVNSFEDLEEALKRVSFVRGSEQSYTNKDLLGIISQVREGKMDVSAVTRSGGLRDKVQQLLSRAS